MAGLSEEMLRVIRGQHRPSAEEKHAQYDQSLQRWWSEYASRKNDEEEEHVADSLLYDERCHLPRTTPRPEFNTPAAPGANGVQQANGVQANGTHANGTQANGVHANGHANGNGAHTDSSPPQAQARS